MGTGLLSTAINAATERLELNNPPEVERLIQEAIVRLTTARRILLTRADDLIDQAGKEGRP